MFGTTPSCFLTPSSKGREAAGAASIVVGVGMRDTGVLLSGLRLVGRRTSFGAADGKGKCRLHIDSMHAGRHDLPPRRAG
jgi:hypothetical protein